MHKKPPRGWVLYDGRCPLCRQGARRMSCAVRPRGFGVVPLQRRWVRDALAAREEEIPDEMLLLLRSGELYCGVDAFLYLGRRIWWAWPAAMLGGLPGFKGLAKYGYAWLARNRYTLSHACTEEGCRLR